MVVTEPSPTHSIPADEDGPFEVRDWIVSVLLAPPAICSDEEAESLAGKFHGTGLDLKTATIGDLQSPSCLGKDGGMRVFEKIENSQGAFESMLSSLRKTTKAWGFDFIPANAGSAGPSRKGSIAPVAHDEHAPAAMSQRGSRSGSQGSISSAGHDAASDVRKNSTVDLTDGMPSEMKKRRSSTQE